MSMIRTQIPMSANASEGLRCATAAAAYDAIVITVGHREYHDWGVAGIRAFRQTNAVIYDVKYVRRVRWTGVCS